jgi:hypothetical protein
LHRSPNVYLHCDDFEPNSNVGALNTEGETSDAVVDTSTCKRLGKLVFTMKTSSFPIDSDDGNITIKYVRVISTPYREGEHWTMYPTSFLPIIDQLRKLHSNDIVHGDIRAYNIIFTNNKDRQGWLIDFDFGGKCVGESPVTYPPGYVSALDDGQRINVPLGEIRKWHDWFALGQLIFIKHTFEAPKDRKIDATDRLSLLEKEIEMLEKQNEMILKWTKCPEGEDSEIEYKVDELTSFLDEYEKVYGFKLCPNNPVKLRGTPKQQDAGDTCKEATSSPLNTKKNVNNPKIEIK